MCIFTEKAGTCCLRDGDEMEQRADVILKRGGGRLLKSGGAWVFDNEIAEVKGFYLNGDLVRVTDFDGYPLGTGFINRNSKIRVRMLTRDADEAIDAEFFRKRIRAAWEYRKKVTDISSCRVIFGEADVFPGITIDKYEDVLVVESLALGMDRRKEEIVDILKEVLAEDGIRIRGVYERSDAKERLKEGMERKKGFIGPEFDTNVRITENGVKYIVDVKDGQKTGFFLDQKYNRKAIQRLCRGADVLDCFTHTGSFGLNAALAGASHVTSVDASQSAIDMAVKNAELNGFNAPSDIGGGRFSGAVAGADGTIATPEGGSPRVEYLVADVLELLPELVAAGKTYDVVILDPPAFAKARASVRNAAKGYREINTAGMKLVKKGGFLATCSCSHFMTRELFEQMLRQSAREAHVRVRQVEARAQAPDHPILWTAAESDYLKFYILQIV